MFSCLLYWHIKEKGAKKPKTYARLKTWMLFFLALFSLMAAIRYTFSLSATTPWLYAIVLVLQQQFQAVSFLLICWYFVKNAEKLLETKVFRNFITIVACADAIAFFIIMWFQVAKLADGHLNELCKTAFFVVPELFCEIIILIFLCVGIKL